MDVNAGPFPAGWHIAANDATSGAFVAPVARPYWRLSAAYASLPSASEVQIRGGAEQPLPPGCDKRRLHSRIVSSGFSFPAWGDRRRTPPKSKADFDEIPSLTLSSPQHLRGLPSALRGSRQLVRPFDGLRSCRKCDSSRRLRDQTRVNHQPALQKSTPHRAQGAARASR